MTVERFLIVCAVLLLSCAEDKAAVKPPSPPPPPAVPTQPAPLPAEPPAPPTPAVQSSGQERPRFSPDGKSLAFHGGKAGERRLYVMQLQDRSVREVTTQLAGDSRDPTWDAQGKRLVFANNTAGHYDLYAVPVEGGKPERLTSFPGDETEPTVAPVRFGFYAVNQDHCGAGANGRMLDSYEKVVFTRRESADSKDSVWFVSMRPLGKPAADEEQYSAHGAHKALLSEKGKACQAPSFSGDGLILTWTCDQGVLDAPARWQMTFVDALATAKGESPAVCHTGAETYDHRGLPQEAASPLCELPRSVRLRGDGRRAALEYLGQSHRAGRRCGRPCGPARARRGTRRVDAVRGRER